MLEFARFYDNIPLHIDEEYAKSTPFGGLIASGVLFFMSAWAKYPEADLFGKELPAGKSTKIEWVKPVALLVMGYRSADAKPRDRHYQYRPPDEVIFYDRF